MITKEQLEECYINKRLSSSKTAKVLGIHKGSVHRLLKKHNIKARSISESLIGKKFTNEHRLKISLSKRGDKHPCFGKKNRYHKRYWYDCPSGVRVSMRSRWEVLYAKFLDKNRIKWDYEVKTFFLQDGSAFTPDFYLIETDTFAEVKGWYHDKHRSRVELFQLAYPEIKFKLLLKADLLGLGINLDETFQGCEKPKLICEWCKQEFNYKDKNQRFCGIKCRNKYLATNPRKTHKNKIPIQNYSGHEKRKYNGNQTGSNNSGAKLTEQTVIEIIELYNQGLSVPKIAKLKSASLGNIYNIINGKSWKHVPRK